MAYEAATQYGEGAYDEDKASELLQALLAEEQWAASYLKSELQEAQIEALKRFYGDPYGDEVEGRSSVTTREVYEIIQWLRPDLRRTFTAGDKVFEFEPVQPGAEEYAEDATDIVNYVFLSDNEGERELDSFIFDGLLQRVGVMAVEWKEPVYSPEQEASGLNLMQVEGLAQDPSTELLEVSEEYGAPDEAHPDGRYFSVRIRKRTKDGYPEVFAIAPEDFRVAARTTDLETARYCGDIIRMMRGEAKQIWPEHADAIDSYQGDTGGFNTDERRAERFRDVESWDSNSLNQAGKDTDAGEVEIMREYIRHDCNGDGYPELVRCYRIGDVLLEYEEVDEHIYAHWTPIPVPHRFFGLSIYDEAHDIQRTKTVLLRNMLDSVYQSVSPRVAYDASKITGQGLDALLTVRPGVAIGVEGPPGDALFPVAVPDLSGSALQAMQWVDRIAESRTGINRSAQPMDPDILHDTAKGVELLQNAASVRKEEIARNLAVGLQVLGRKIYRTLHKHQNEGRMIRVSGQWRNINPKAWDADMACTVSVGLGTGAKDKQLMMLQMIQADQVAAFQAFGPANPVVTLEKMHNLVTEKLRVMGYKSAGKFFGEPVDPQTGQPWQPQPQPSPDQMKIQAQVQEGQARLQLDAQKAQVAAQLDVQKAQMDAQVRQAEADGKAQADARKAELDATIARMKAKGELSVMREKAVLEAQLRREQMQFEMQMALAQFEFEKEIAREKLTIQREQAEAKVSMNGSAGTSGPSFGGKPG